MNKYKKIFNRFEKLFQSSRNKFQKLPYWLNFVSYQFSKEDNDKLPAYYYHYKRGSIIRVNFGVNPGSEFSFTHFAIVLDKHDNSKKNTLTVIPLTSKKGKNRYSLGKDIFNQTVSILQTQLNQIIKESQDVQKELDSATIATPSLEQKVYIAAKHANELNRVVETYSEFNKDSYVRLSDITTISKLRIKRINKFDPSGKIKLTEQQMQDISLELSKLYLDKL